MSDLTSELPHYLVLDDDQVEVLVTALEEATASFDSRANDYLAVDNEEMALVMEERAYATQYLLDHVIGSTDDSVYPASEEVAA